MATTITISLTGIGTEGWGAANAQYPARTSASKIKKREAMLHFMVEFMMIPQIR